MLERAARNAQHSRIQRDSQRAEFADYFVYSRLADPNRWIVSLCNSKMSSSTDGLSRLLEKQQEELEALDEKISLWNKYHDEYRDLSKMIDKMKDKVRIPHRIPIGGSKMAFVEGDIIHTNEILVLLGDNLFALRSSKQANQIIERRMANIKKNLKDSEDARRKTQDWLNIASEHKRDKEEFVEIIETM